MDWPICFPGLIGTPCETNYMTQNAYCYRCGTHHPIEEMRQMATKNGKRWRCIKSIEATKTGIAQRDAYGQQTTTNNKAEAQAKLRIIRAAQQ